MNKYTNIETILDRLKRNPLMSSLDLEAVIDWTFDFFGIVGHPDMFEDKSIVIDINEYRSILPDDFVSVIQVISTNNNSNEVLNYNLDTARNINNDALKSSNNIDAFSIKGNYIYFNNKEGSAIVLYKSILLDNCGLPLIPYDGNFLKALESYIKKEYYNILFDIGRVNRNVLDKADQEYCWNVGALENDLNKLDLSKAEAFFNSYSQLIIRTNEFKHRFKNYGVKEYLKSK